MAYRYDCKACGNPCVDTFVCPKCGHVGDGRFVGKPERDDIMYRDLHRFGSLVRKSKEEAERLAAERDEQGRNACELFDVAKQRGTEIFELTKRAESAEATIAEAKSMLPADAEAATFAKCMLQAVAKLKDAEARVAYLENLLALRKGANQ